MNVLTQHRFMNHLCVGCGLCLGICPKNAISLKPNDVLTIEFDYSRCTRCGLCIKACVALSNFYNEMLRGSDVLGRIEKVFFGYSTDYEVRYHAASGGVVTSLVLCMLKRKTVDEVFVTKMEGFKPISILTDSAMDVMSAQGSIYFKTFSLRIFRKLVSHLEKGKRICIVGLPCQISILKKILRVFEDNLCFIGLICNHVNEHWFLKHIIERYLPKFSKPTAIEPRKNGWLGGVRFTYELDGDIEQLVVPQSKFWGLFPSLNISSPLGCLLCADHLGLKADIVVGDAWHPKFTEKNSAGVSIVIVRTLKGLELVKSAVHNRALYVEETSLRDMFIAQGHHLIEGVEYTPFRQRCLQRRMPALRELNELDKIIVLLLITTNMALSKSRILRKFLSIPTIEKAFQYVKWFLLRQKNRKLYNIASTFMSK